MSKRAAVVDPWLQAIDDLERQMIAAHDEKILLGVSAEEVARFRPAVVAQARAIAAQRRLEYHARMHR